jgi:uncharacterized protein
MSRNNILEEITKKVKNYFKNDHSGHDWWHTWRVIKIAEKIAEKEGGDIFIIRLGALLHDVEDFKFSKEQKLAEKWLNDLKIDENIIKHVVGIVKNVSFKGAFVKNKIDTLEGKIVQDADRLDVLGAMGIARTFTYGGYKGRDIYNPTIKPTLHKSFKTYKNNKSSSINHFYEKLLLVRDLLNTKTAKRVAEKRHKFLEQFLKEFFLEWQVKDL